MAVSNIIKNSSGQITQIIYYNSDGKTPAYILYYTAGLMSQRVNYMSDGKTISSTINYTYVRGVLYSATTLNSSGTIQSVVVYNSNGTTAQTNLYSYNSNGTLNSITTNDTSGTLLQTVTYSYGTSTNPSGSNTTDANNKIVFSNTYTYNSAGKIIKNTIANASGTVIETDSYQYGRNNVLVCISKTNSYGQIFEQDFYSPDGINLGQIYTYTYSSTASNASITSAVISDRFGNPLTLYTIGANGYISSATYNIYNDSLQLIEVQKANSSNIIIEEDYFINGVKSQIRNFSSTGKLMTNILYDSNGNLLQTTTYTLNSAGQVTQAVITNASGKVIETDSYSFAQNSNSGILKTLNKLVGPLNYNQYSIISRYDSTGVFLGTENQTINGKNETDYFFNTAGQITERQQFYDGWLVADSLYSNAIIISQTTYLNGLKSQLINYDSTGQLITEVIQFKNGLETSQSLYDTKGLLQTVNYFDNTGKIVTEVDTYTRNSNNTVNTVTKTVNNAVIEVDSYIYNSFGQLTTINKVNGAGILTEVDSYSNGKINFVTHPNIVVNKPKITPTSPTTTPSSWSIKSGWGEANILAAMNVMMNSNLAAISAPSGTASVLSTMGFQNIWAQGATGKGIVIADIDTGFDLTNSTLLKNINFYKNGAYNYNFLTNSTSIQDDNGHGTETASELVAGPATGNGVEGGAYGAQLIVLKALNSAGSGTDANIVAAINQAVTDGANIINLSLGSMTPDTAIQQAVQYASDHGVVVCMAAGNDSAASPEYPAAYAQTITNAIAVGASQVTGSSYSMASFSNGAGTSTTYNFIDALGVNIVGYGLKGQLYQWSGTSMATPLIAAEVSDLMSLNSQKGLGLSTTQIINDLMTTAKSF